MVLLNQAQQRLLAVIEEIKRLKESEFPYTHPQEALEYLEKHFRRHLSILSKTPSSPPAFATSVCKSSLRDLYLYLPILGFLLRSTNVRNAFEVYGPLLRLSRGLLESETKLVLSSEWDFSPYTYTYRAFSGLAQFILIGLPATESSNPLLIPLAGHELGHAVWGKAHTAKFTTILEERVLAELTGTSWDKYHEMFPGFEKQDLLNTTLFSQAARHTWVPAATWAQLQVEEIFCDFVGLRLFAESFFHAFAYLLSPGSPGKRAMDYPPIRQRVAHMLAMAAKMDVHVPDGYEEQFEDEEEPDDPTLRLLVSTSDKVSSSLVPELIDLAIEIPEEAAPSRNREAVRKISEEMQSKICPIKEHASLGDLLNAGWECACKDDLWQDRPQIKPEDRDRILKDLLLKSMEILEILERWKLLS